MEVKLINELDSELAICSEPHIWEKIRPYIVHGDTIIFDFIGIRMIGPVFVSQVIARPLDILSVDEYCNQIRFKRVNENLAGLIERSLQRNIDFRESVLYVSNQLKPRGAEE